MNEIAPKSGIRKGELVYIGGQSNGRSVFFNTINEETNQTMTKRIDFESCHEIGYGWTLENVPEELTEEEIEELVTQIANWTDTPDPETVQDALNDLCYNNPLTLERDHLYQQITGGANLVHREIFTQSIKEVKTND